MQIKFFHIEIIDLPFPKVCEIKDKKYSWLIQGGVLPLQDFSRIDCRSDAKPVADWPTSCSARRQLAWSVPASPVEADQGQQKVTAAGPA
jgi:hypothetical protein